MDTLWIEIIFYDNQYYIVGSNAKGKEKFVSNRHKDKKNCLDEAKEFAKNNNYDIKILCEDE
jgi:hypothetical protein